MTCGGVKEELFDGGTANGVVGNADAMMGNDVGAKGITEEISWDSVAAYKWSSGKLDKKKKINNNVEEYFWLMKELMML